MRHFARSAELRFESENTIDREDPAVLNLVFLREVTVDRYPGTNLDGEMEASLQ